MPNLPNAVSLQEAVRSQFTQGYDLQNDDGTLMNIINKVFKFSIREDPAELPDSEPIVSVDSVTPSASGFITVNVFTSVVSVTITATAMASLEQKQYYYTLWMDQDLPDATALVTGSLFASLVAQP